MALPFLNGARRRESLVALDLGGRTTKAIEVRQHGDKYVLANYAIVDAPIYDNTISADMLCEHLKSVMHALAPKTKTIAIGLNVSDSILRTTEMPAIPINDMRGIIKSNTQTYLQQDLPEHVFDCFICAPSSSPNQNKSKSQPNSNKLKVLVGAAKADLIENVQAGARQAGLVAESVVPGLIGPINAFEMAMPEIFARDIVALVEMGFRSTSICLIQEGETVLSRVLSIAGDTLTSGLADTMGISYAEAEGIKVGLPGEVQSALEPLLIPLGRELRASIDCFEHQQDRAVSHVFVSGASARSQFILQTLQEELMLECKSWNPVSFMDTSLPRAKQTDFEHVAPQLTVAVGTALAAY